MARIACLAASGAAIGACGAEAAQQPARKMIFDIDQTGCAPASPVDAAEILLVDPVRICVHQKLTIGAPGTRTAHGVDVEAGQRFDLVVQLFCGGDLSCPCCHGQQSIVIADQARVTVSVGTTTSLPGGLCIPPTVGALLSC